MMATYELIATLTAGSGGASSFDFTSIPQTYTDIVFRMSLRGTNNDTYFSLQTRFNNSGTTNLYYSNGLSAYNGSISQAGQNGLSYLYAGNPPSNPATSNTFGNVEFYVPNYSGSERKSVSMEMVGENNAATAFTQFWACIWYTTPAITQVTFFNEYGNFAEHSSAQLYGIKNS